LGTAVTDVLERNGSENALRWTDVQQHVATLFPLPLGELVDLLLQRLTRQRAHAEFDLKLRAPGAQRERALERVVALDDLMRAARLARDRFGVDFDPSCWETTSDDS
jgi:hypothetical protein